MTVVPNVADWLTTSEAARELNVSGKTVRDWADNGDLVAVETHLGWLFEPESVQAKRVRREGSSP